MERGQNHPRRMEPSDSSCSSAAFLPEYHDHEEEDVTPRTSHMQRKSLCTTPTTVTTEASTCTPSSGAMSKKRRARSVAFVTHPSMTPPREVRSRRKHNQGPDDNDEDYEDENDDDNDADEGENDDNPHPDEKASSIHQQRTRHLQACGVGPVRSTSSVSSSSASLSPEPRDEELSFLSECETTASETHSCEYGDDQLDSLSLASPDPQTPGMSRNKAVSSTTKTPVNTRGDTPAAQSPPSLKSFSGRRRKGRTVRRQADWVLPSRGSQSEPRVQGSLWPSSSSDATDATLFNTPRSAGTTSRRTRASAGRRYRRVASSCSSLPSKRSGRSLRSPCSFETSGLSQSSSLLSSAFPYWWRLSHQQVLVWLLCLAGVTTVGLMFLTSRALHQAEHNANLSHPTMEVLFQAKPLTPPDSPYYWTFSSHRQQKQQVWGSGGLRGHMLHDVSSIVAAQSPLSTQQKSPQDEAMDDDALRNKAAEQREKIDTSHHSHHHHSGALDKKSDGHHHHHEHGSGEHHSHHDEHLHSPEAHSHHHSPPREQQITFLGTANLKVKTGSEELDSLASSKEAGSKPASRLPPIEGTLERVGNIFMPRPLQNSRQFETQDQLMYPMERPTHQLPALVSKDAHSEAASPWPRVVLVDGSVTTATVEDRVVQLYPPDFTDNTQLYSILDSSDERMQTMERREPLEDGECVPMQEWQTTFYPSCNAMHELDMSGLGNDKDARTELNLFGTKGFWRNAWKVDSIEGFHENGEKDTFVLKTLKIEHRFEDAHFEHDRVDAVAMERLTASPHVINIFGYCGHSVMTEYADGKRLGELADKRRHTPLARLAIARDIAAGLADMHGIDGDGNATFVHLDVNPANVVSVKGTLKLNDFNIGILRRWNTTSNQPCGFPAQYPNPQWRSPEEARGENNLTEKVDVFSMGHIFFRLICGHEPWHKLEPGGRPSFEEVNEKVKRGVLPYIPEEIITSTDPEVAAIREAMLRCYTLDPLQRPSAREIVRYLERSLEGQKRKQTTLTSLFVKSRLQQFAQEQRKSWLGNTALN